MKNAILFVLVMLLSFGMVEAVTVERIALQNCAFDTAGPLTCAQTATFSCEVTDTTGATAITSVEYTIGGGLFDAVLTAGTTLNGTWSSTITMDSSVPATSFIDFVEARNAAGQTCSGVGAVEVNQDNCFINFNTITSFTNACTCDYEITETCGIDDVLFREHVPGAGCTIGEIPFNTTGVCDYCDPGWEVQNFICDINRTQSFQDNGDYFTGVADLEFESSDPACCLTTGLSSDCNAPANANTEFVCTQGYWLGETNDVTGSRMNAGTKLLADETEVRGVTKSSQGLTGGGISRQIQPIVFDIDDDGVVETIAFTNPSSLDGRILVYDPDFTLEQEISVGRTIIGDPGLFEFDPRGGFTTEYLDGSNGAGVAIIAQDGLGDNYFMSWRFETTSLVAKVNSAVGDDETASVFCEKDWCYTVVSGKFIYRFDPVSGSSSSITVTAATATDSTDWRNSPIKIPNSSIIVAKTIDASGNVLVSACDFGGSTCSTFPSNYPPRNVSELYIGPVTDPAGFGLSSPVYWTEDRGDAGLFTFSAFLEHSTLTWHNADQKEIIHSGSEAVCITAPAGAQCPAEGALVGSYWEPGQAVVSSPTLEFDYTDQATQFAPIGPGLSAAGEANIGRIVCSGNTCFMMSGFPVTNGVYNKAGASLYVSTAGGPWVGATMNPNLPQYTIDTTGTDCDVSDMILMTGGLNGQLYMVRSELIQWDGVAKSGSTFTMPDASCTAGVEKYQGIYVEKYNPGTDTWSSVYSNAGFDYDDDIAGSPTASSDSLGIGAGSASYGREMMCGEDRCWMITNSGSSGNPGTRYALEITSSDVVNINNPEGSIAGLDLDKGQALFYGYAVSQNAIYYAFAANQDATQYVVRYDNGAPSSPVLMEAIDPARAVLGLAADPAAPDTIRWAEIPTTYESSCIINYTADIGVTTFDSEIEALPLDTVNTGGTHGWTGCTFGGNTWGDTRRWKSTCNFNTRIAINGGTPGTSSTEEVIRRGGGYAGRTCGGGVANGFVTGASKEWSVGSFDAAGDYYAQFLDQICFPNYIAGGGGGSGNCLATASGGAYPDLGGAALVLAVISEEGTYHPWKVEYPETQDPDGEFRPGYEPCVARVMSSESGPGCLPMQISSNVGSARSSPGASTSGTGAFSVYGQPSISRAVQSVLTFSETYVDVIGLQGVEAFFIDISCFVNSAGAGLSKLTGVNIPGSACPAQLLAADVDNDGRDEAVISTGVYSITNGDKVEAFTTLSASGIGVVDLTSDSFIDFVFVTGTVIQSIVSLPDIQVAFSDELSVQGVQCTSDSDQNGLITAVPFGVTAQNPEDLVYSATLYNSADQVIDITFPSGSSTQLLQPKTNGEKEVFVKVRDPLTSEEVEKSCTVEVAGVPVQAPLSEQTLAEGCSLDPDGEFNYDNGVQNHGWLIDINGRQPTLDGNIATFNLEDTNMIHGLDCQDAELRLEAEVFASETSNLKIKVEATDDGLSESIGGLWVYRGDLYSWDGSSGVTEIVYVGLDDGNYHTLSMRFDRSQNEYVVGVDGNEIQTNLNMNGFFDGKYVAVVVQNLEGLSQVDYIRTAGLSGAADDVRDTETQAKETAASGSLTLCDEDATGNDYTNVDTYCGQIANPDDAGNTICDFDDQGSVQLLC
jgi:hypothetical protein